MADTVNSDEYNINIDALPDYNIEVGSPEFSIEIEAQPSYTIEFPEQGPQGPQGDAGPQGPVGPQGEQGERGPSAVEISDTEPTDPEVEIWLCPSGTVKIPLLCVDGGRADSIYTAEQIIDGGNAWQQ